MLFRMFARRIMAAAALAIVTAAALGQAEQGRISYSRMLDIDSLLDNHARMLARRYNLNQEQDLYTQALLREKAHAFLDKHRDELFDLVDRMVEVKAGGEMSPQELVAWGKQALPLYEEAKALILQGNNDWRQILNEDQRKTHDEDLQEMYGAFGTTEDQLQRIVAGQMTLDEFRKGPARQVTGPTQQLPMPAAPPTAQPQVPVGPDRTPRPTAPATGPRPAVSNPTGGAAVKSAPGPSAPNLSGTRHRLARGRGPGTTAAPQASPRTGSDESQWEAYVREFIQKYQLDDGQKERALSYLRDAQEAAQRIIDKTKPEIEQLDKKVAGLGASKDPEKLKELNEINERRTKLLEPINGIFEKQLKPHLERLPTQKQRQAAEQAGKQPPGTDPATRNRAGRPGPQPQPPQPPQPAPQPEPAPPQNTGP